MSSKRRVHDVNLRRRKFHFRRSRDTLQTNLETSWRYRNDVLVSAGRSVVERLTIAAATVGCNPPATFIKYKTLAIDFDHT